MTQHRFEFVNIDTRAVDDMLKMLDVAEHNKAVISALNKTATPARDEGKTAISELYNIKKTDVKLTITKAKGTPVAKIRASYRPLNLIKFGATQTSGGVQVSIMRSEGSKTISHAFIAQPQGKNWGRYGQMQTMSLSKPLVFMRGGVNGFSRYKNRLYSNYPLNVAGNRMTGPSLGAVMKNETVNRRMIAVIDRELPKNLIEEVRALGK